jgi:hypothetical protein
LFSTQESKRGKLVDLALDPDRVVRTLFFIAAVLVALSLACEAAQAGFGIHHAYGLIHSLSLDDDGNLPALFSSLLLLACAGLLYAISAIEAGERWRWAGLAAIFTLMGIDEIAQFHEVLAGFLHKKFQAGGYLYFTWVVPGTLFVIAVALAYSRFLLRLPSRTRIHMLISGALYVSGALGMELIAGAHVSATGQRDFQYAMMATLEEALEMAGLIWFLRTLMRHLGAFQLSLRFGRRAAAVRASCAAPVVESVPLAARELEPGPRL